MPKVPQRRPSGKPSAGVKTRTPNAWSVPTAMGAREPRKAATRMRSTWTRSRTWTSAARRMAAQESCERSPPSRAGRPRNESAGQSPDSAVRHRTASNAAPAARTARIVRRGAEGAGANGAGVADFGTTRRRHSHASASSASTAAAAAPKTWSRSRRSATYGCGASRLTATGSSTRGRSHTASTAEGGGVVRLAPLAGFVAGRCRIAGSIAYRRNGTARCGLGRLAADHREW